MALTVAVLQSNYIPWKGYFDVIHDADLFVFYDTAQYTKNDWRNRNRIKTATGCRWLTVPVGSCWHQAIHEVELPVGPASSWAATHWRRLEAHYRKAPYFDQLSPLIKGFYEPGRFRTLSDLNQEMIRTLARELLGITTRFADSREHPVSGARLDRLLALLREVGATRYVSGPAAKTYVEPARFADLGIELVWKDYAGYPEYPQFHPPFEHAVTILDLLFHTGPRASWYVWGWRAALAHT